MTAHGLPDIATRIAACTACPLAEGRTQTVPGDGDPQAELMFIGEAPGFHEDRQGRPFVGQAGRLLDQLLSEIQLTRADVFVANVLKCRPPNNRDPLPEEIATCDPFLSEQIDLIRPKLIVPLGRFAMQHLLPRATISRAHGKAARAGRHLIFPVYHPAAALRQGTMMRTLREDFLQIPAILAKTERPAVANLDTDDAAASAAPSITQLPLL